MNITNQPQVKCAVLLAAYNGVKYLETQISSILQQNLANITIFISVDLSNDGTETLVDQLSNIHHEIIVLSHGKHFGSAAKNFFRLICEVDFSGFHYVALSDQDDYWYTDKIERAINKLSGKKYDAYSSNVIATWDNGKNILVDKAQPQKKWDYVFEAGGPGCTYVMNIQLLGEIKKNLMDNWARSQSINHHDWYCYAFARANGFKWFIDPQPSMQYRQHDTNQEGVNFGLKAYIHRMKQMKNGAWFYQAFLISDLIDLKINEIRWSTINRATLIQIARNALQCRRNLVDGILFFLMCMMLLITGIPDKDDK